MADSPDISNPRFLEPVFLSLGGLRNSDRTEYHNINYLLFLYALQIEARMNKISTDRPGTFIEAVQLLYSFHCCLHLSGEPVSIGRLDQLLAPFLQGTPTGEAQEIIDCLFVKLCEHVHLNTRLLNDMGAWGTTAVPYASTGMFPNGDTINQWVQQVRTLRV